MYFAEEILKSSSKQYFSIWDSKSSALIAIYLGITHMKYWQRAKKCISLTKKCAPPPRHPAIRMDT